MHAVEATRSSERGTNCALRASGFLSQLSPSALREFEQIKFTSTYPQGTVLFVEDEGPRGVYVICQGSVKVMMNSAEGKSLILRIAKPGEVLGLNATITNSPYKATAEVLHPAKLDFIRREDFLRLLKSYPDAALHVAEHLSANYQAACDQIRTLGLSTSAPEKLARILLEWSSKGETTQQGTRVKLALTHEEIAQSIGIARETVTRVLAKFKDRHLAALHGSTLVVQNRPGLESFVRS